MAASCTLRAIPEDVYKEILQEQKVIKKKKEVKVYSIELTIIHMLKEFIKCKKRDEQPIWEEDPQQD